MIIENENMLAVKKRGKPDNMDPVSQEDLHKANADHLILGGMRIRSSSATPAGKVSHNTKTIA